MRPRPQARSKIKPSQMRAAGAITGLLVLGAFVIPGTYGGKTEIASGAARTAAPRLRSSAELDLGFATLAGRIYDERGRPLGGAIVSLAGSGFWPARSVRSGTDGRFFWPQIPAGIYELRASKGPLVAPSIEGLILDAGARRAFAIQLAEGWTLLGKVVDIFDGRAIPNALLTVTSSVLGLHTRQGRSAADGSFELPGIVGDELGLYVEADGYVAAGPLRHAVAEPPIMVRLERASTIEGRVVDAQGRSIEGALVRAFGAGELRDVPRSVADSLTVTSGPVPPISAAASEALAFVRQVESNPDGSFRLSNLRSGTYTLAVTHDEFSSTESEPIRLRPGATRSDVRLEMRAGAELAGRVVDERGNGLEGIPVELRVTGDRLPQMSVTAPDGSFSFRGLRGELSVTALPYDLPPVRTSIVIEEEALVTVELALASTLYTLRGRVVDERGFGVGGALLTVSSSRAETPVRRNAKSDADGMFSVPALPEPPFELSAEHPSYGPTRLTDIERVDDVRVVMSAGVILIGEVRDSWTRDGLAGVLVELEGPIDGTARSQSDGTFVFRRLPIGTYDVSFSHPDYESQSRRVVLEAPQYVDRPQELDTVRLEPGGNIEGEVLDARGEAVPNAEVAWGDPPRWDRAARSDAAGRFLLRGVPAGTTWITARHPAAGENSSSGLISVRPVETSPGAFVRLPGAVSE